MPHVYTFHDRSLVVLWLFLMSLASELSIKMHGCWPLAASFLWSQWDLKTSRSWQSWWHTEVCVPLSVLHGTVRVAPSIRTENDYDINDIPQCVALSTGALYECAYNEVILMLLHACIVIAFITRMWDMSYVNSLCKLWLPPPSDFYVTLSLISPID